ncbi:hypothetical protein ACNKH9_11745 [Metapseudomonas otitidis]|uniref:hypothetical protein n=1 Tax=Metapseudomonas otitidis TaxID=319939 RepID=UPI003A8C7829
MVRSAWGDSWISLQPVRYFPEGPGQGRPGEGTEMDDYQEELLDLHARERDMPEPADDATEL